MKAAYNYIWLKNLQIVKAASQWLRSGLISQENFDAIKKGYPSALFHPNFIIRILLFLATVIVLSGITGLLVLMFIGNSERMISILSISYGLASFFVLDVFLINGKRQYKSGITEALLYHSILFTVIGTIDFIENRPLVYAVLLLGLFTFAAFRYLDLISTVGALCSFGYIAFDVFYQLGGIVQQLIPLIFIALFTPLYFFFRKTRSKKESWVWDYCLIVGECVCLLFVYAAGNYLVVRELSVELMGLELMEGGDIPLAFLFYLLTVAIPIVYLYFGITRKDIVLIRTSLFLIAFSVFTFKYYYSTGHHEITFTIGGLILFAVCVIILRWLKVSRNGYTRENVLSEKWADSDAHAFLISQTMGVDIKQKQGSGFGGGNSGGGGASSGF